MQYLIVRPNKKTSKNARVLINGERNGFINQFLMLNEGFVEISIDLPRAQTKEIELKDTTRQKPMEIIIPI